MGTSSYAINNLFHRQNWVGDHFTFRILELVKSPFLVLYIKANIILGKQFLNNICLRPYSFQITISILKFLYNYHFCFPREVSALKYLSQWKQLSSEWASTNVWHSFACFILHLFLGFLIFNLRNFKMGLLLYKSTMELYIANLCKKECWLICSSI